MATLTDIQSVTVALRAGVSEATLPNNVKMRSGKSYAISLEDWSKISQGARDSVVDAPTFNTAAYIVPGITATTGPGTAAVSYLLDLSTINNKTTVALVNADAQAPKKFVLGEVVRGFGDSAFKLVLADAGSATVAAGSVVVWGGNGSSLVTQNAFKAASTVTSDYSDVSDDGGSFEFAGVAIGTITAGNYGWIQIAGTAYSTKVEANVVAGDSVAVSDNTDEKGTSVSSEVQTITFTSYDAADTVKLTISGTESTGSAAASLSAGVTTANLQTIADALFTIKVPGYTTGDCVVTQTTINAEYVFTFANDLGDIAAITVTSGSGSAAGTVVETVKGSTGRGDPFGTALNTDGAGLANVNLTSALARVLRSRDHDVFRNPRN